MASKSVEDVHVSQLNKLIAESGLECVRSRRESLELESLEGELEEQHLEEEGPEFAAEALREEEEIAEEIEEEHEEVPDIFPSPSLRKVLPDRIRYYESANRIHVLPETFKTDIDPDAIPKIAYTAQQKYIDTLAGIVGCNKYKSSLAEFWFLDTLANLLGRAQEDGLDRPTQTILILWFCEWMKEIQQFDAADRKRMLRRFQDNMLSAVRFVTENSHLPTPLEAGVYYKAPDEPVSGMDSSATMPSVVQETKHTVTFTGASFECSLRDLAKIIHYIFDLFSTDYQFDLVRSVFTFTPDYIHIEAPYQMQNPKRLYTPLKTKLKKVSPAKKEIKSPLQKGKKKEVDTADYLALMELKARDDKAVEEQEERDREDYNLRSHILPLSFVATEELFDKYWPPPPPPEPEPEPEPEVKKGKGKGKK